MNALALRFRVPVLTVLALAASAVACGGSTTTPPAGGNDAGKDAHAPALDAPRDSRPGPSPAEEAGCDAIAILPAIVTATDAKTGAPICDPNISILGDADGGAGTDAGDGFSCGGSQQFGGCPTSTPDGGNLACVFGLYIEGGPVTIVVSAPGYASKVVTNVKGGEGGCVPTVLGSQVDVALEPVVADAGGGVDAG